MTTGISRIPISSRCSIDQEWEAAVRASLPELPAARRDRFQSAYRPSRATMRTYLRRTGRSRTTSSRRLWRSQVLRPGRGAALAKPVSNWVMTDVLRVMAEQKVEIASFPIVPGTARGDDRAHPGRHDQRKDRERDLRGDADHARGPAEDRSRNAAWCRSRMVVRSRRSWTRSCAHMQHRCEQYLGGNERIFGFFVGETMKRMQGKGNPKMVNEVLKAQLAARRV